jgi:predicted transposase/invertase (TIGR01784 family)
MIKYGKKTKKRNENIHDKYLKAVLGKSTNAKSFIQDYLPTKVIDCLNLETLSSVKTDFIDKEFEESYSDLLYKIKTKDNKEIFIYALFEHKSYIDKFTTIQMLKYISSIILKYKTKTAPIVIPILLYSGKREWKNVKDIYHIYGEFDLELKDFIPTFDFLYYNFNQTKNYIGNDEIKSMIFGFQIVHDVNKLDSIRDNVNFINIDEFILSILVKYLIKASHKKNKTILIQKMKKNLKEVDIMSVAQALRDEGKQIGLNEGKQIGLNEGKIETAKKLLLKGLDLNFISEVTDLSIEQIKSLK